MKKVKRYFLLVIFFLSLLNFLINSKEEKEKKYKIVNFKAKNVRYNNKTKNVFASGEVLITSGDMEITCESLLYNRETEIAKIWGNPVITQPGTKITCEKLTIDFKERKILVENKIEMVQEKKKIERETTLKEELGETITLHCDRIEYYYEKKEGIAEGNIKVFQEDATASGKKAYYQGKEERIIVEGDVRLERKNGEWITCQKAIISLKEDSIETEGLVESQLLIEEEKIPETKF
jgi:lipopolysaccharide assembly outer membrane protein LptD (OstA)